ncbi:hypothetical protein [Dyadobacter sp. CY323]|uniref:hypothetical protein n=1 Tax=Dyadobacter sp. CY323 TaxID=2907302 RepID=UPI001F1E8554|nr:hypothetical protein [Dyadobacter sp. CY323]MCE6992755.1 hypothetical protein [Dyadobacter sp. CY323]
MKLYKTALLGAFLLIPFFLKTIGFEPYPAVLLPTGGIRIKNNNGLATFKTTELSAFDVISKKWIDVDEGKFIQPIPIHYFRYLTDQKFGLDKGNAIAKSRKGKLMSKLGIKMDIKNNDIGKEREEEVKKWIKYRLSAQSIVSSKIRILTEVRSISLTTGLITKTYIENEEFVNLD